jgi:hypothetical protein
LGTNTFLLLSGAVGAEDETEGDSVNEILRDSLLRSPLSDKVFGLSFQKFQPLRVKGTALLQTMGKEYPLTTG